MVTLRKHYVGNVTKVIRKIAARGRHLAVAGPGVLGESGLGIWTKAALDQFRNRVKMLDAYTAINQEITGKRNISYINVRAEYLKKIPKYQCYKSGCLTVDGEHQNQRGTDLVSKLFAADLKLWLDFKVLGIDYKTGF